MKPAVKRSGSSRLFDFRVEPSDPKWMAVRTDDRVLSVLDHLQATLASRMHGLGMPRPVRSLRIIPSEDKVQRELDEFYKSYPREADWDGQGALPLHADLVDSMYDLVNAYARRLPQHRLATLDLEINPVVDGSIDIAWYASKARMLMNVRHRDGELCMLYYGALQGETDSIKGHICSPQPAEFLVTWMNTVLF